MIRNVLTRLKNIEPYPVAALVLFLLAFAVVLYRVMRMKRDQAAALGRLPLEDSKEEEGEHRHE
jgi:hypothetical protein